MSGETAQKENAQDVSLTPADQSKAQRPISPSRISRSTSAIPQLSRSRKNSQEFSPTRNSALGGPLSTIPSAAAVQRALSAHRPLATPGSVDGANEGARMDRRSGPNSPAWPISPRLKSPPPSTTNSRQVSSKKSEDQMPSNTSLKRLATVSTPETTAAMRIPEPTREHSGMHSTRGPSSQGTTLETVAEGSLPSTPSVGPVKNPPPDTDVDTQPNEKPEPKSEASTIKDSDASGEGDVKTPTRAKETAKPPRPADSKSLAKRSLSNLATVKSKPLDPPRTMTVETEPVTSLPPLNLGDRGLSGRDGMGSVRTKPSSETIKPKKEKKKTTRKPTSGTMTSKADIFEAKVASAVDEADTSDSDETFVYESNPPDSRSHRNHSRTPSGNSVTSQDQYSRNRHGVRSGSALGGKKSMKFSNSAFNSHLDEDGTGSGRGSTRNASTPRHHHISRHNRAPHTSILDNNSPFTQAGKANSPRTSVNNIQRLSRPNSPRLANGLASSSPQKGGAFDIYDDVADDERTPLMGSIRVNRRSRRPAHRNSEYYEGGNRSHCGRFGGCLILGLVLLIMCVGVATFIVGLNQPLLNVEIRHLQNILASEQELMLDLHVDAVNPNIFAIAVQDLDVNLFAESAYAGTTKEWQSKHRDLRWARRVESNEVEETRFPFGWPHFGADDGVDEGNDPIDDPEPGVPKLLLGRILNFDSPLTFDASPVRRTRTTSVGEIQLAKPGNATEISGSARWERVIQHPFDLIVRGVIKYQLPLSSKIRTAKIAGKAKVYPDDDGEEEDPSIPGNDTTTAI